jgi:T5orf172 domain
MGFSRLPWAELVQGRSLWHPGFNKMGKSAVWGRDLYIATAGGFTKVGRSQHVPVRLLQLRRNMPFQDVQLYAVVHAAGPLETSVHRELTQLGAQRHGEWFLAPPAVVLSCVARQLANLDL